MTENSNKLISTGGSVVSFKHGNDGRLRHAMLAILVILLLAGCQILNNDSPTWYGYVVGADRRIYMVNLASGELVWISRVLDEVGLILDTIDISDIDIHPEESILYISSEDYVGRRDYVPIVAVRLNATADPMFQIPMDHPSGMVSNGHSAILNSAANHLYAGFYKGDARFVILDPVTGEKIGSLDTVIREPARFSPDGTKMLRVDRRRNDAPEGEDYQYSAVVVIQEVESGEVVSRIELKSNPGRYPSWGVPGDYIVKYRGPYSNSTIEVYDKMNGKLLNSYGIVETFDSYPTQFYATHIPATGNVAMSMGGSVIVFDPLTAEVITRTNIGVRLSEVVVTDKPLMVHPPSL